LEKTKQKIISLKNDKREDKLFVDSLNI